MKLIGHMCLRCFRGLDGAEFIDLIGTALHGWETRPTPLTPAGFGRSCLRRSGILLESDAVKQEAM